MVSNYFNVAPPEITVMFRGGSCGNFLCHAIETHLLKTNLFKDTIYYPKWNEYRFKINSNVDTDEIKPPLMETHLNLWFRENRSTKYGEEVYTVSRYNYMFEYWKDTKFIVIQPNHNIAYTECLCTMKNYIKTGEEIYKTDDIKYALDYFNKVVKHYNFFSKIARQKGIKVIDVDFRDLFVFDTKHQLKRIADFLDKPYDPMMLKLVRDYHEKNQQLMTDYGYDRIVQLKR